MLVKVEVEQWGERVDGKVGYKWRDMMEHIVQEGINTKKKKNSNLEAFLKTYSQTH